MSSIKLTEICYENQKQVWEMYPELRSAKTTTFTLKQFSMGVRCWFSKDEIIRFENELPHAIYELYTQLTKRPQYDEDDKLASLNHIVCYHEREVIQIARAMRGW